MAVTEPTAGASPAGSAPDVPPPPPPPVAAAAPPGFTTAGTSSARWAILGGTAALAAGLSAYILANDPNTSAAYPPCIVKRLTGFDCPGCGGMRCVHSLLQGDLVGAASHNLLAVVLLPIVGYLLIRQVALLWGKELPPLPSFRYTGWALFGVAAVFTVVRNIPGTPLAWLGSTA